MIVTTVNMVPVLTGLAHQLNWALLLFVWNGVECKNSRFLATHRTSRNCKKELLTHSISFLSRMQNLERQHLKKKVSTLVDKDWLTTSLDFKSVPDIKMNESYYVRKFVWLIVIIFCLLYSHRFFLSQSSGLLLVQASKNLLRSPDRSPPHWRWTWANNSLTFANWKIIKMSEL